MFSKEIQFSGENMPQEQLLMLTFLLRYSEETQKTYKWRLKVFYAWCQQNRLHMVDDVKRIHLEVYVKYLREERKNKASSISGAMHTISSFYEMLEVDDIIYRNPAKHVKLPKSYQSDYKRLHLNRTQFTNLVEYTKTLGSTETSLILILGIMGLRCSEVCNLNIDSVKHYESGHRLIRFSGKGSKPASLPMPVLLLRELDAHLSTCSDSGPLFLNHAGVRMTRQQLTRRVKRLTRKAPGVPEVSPHALRRSMITNSLNAGADIREVQKAARHSDLRTTSRVYDQGTPSYDSNSFNVLAGYVSGAI